MTFIVANKAVKSLIKDLKGNGISHKVISPSRILVDDSPKVQMAYRMVKERFGQDSIILKDTNQ